MDFTFKGWRFTRGCSDTISLTNNFNDVQNDAAKLPTKIGPNKLAFF